jgi:hypothetical protein
MRGGYQVAWHERFGGWAVIDPEGKVLAVKPSEARAHSFLRHHLEARAILEPWRRAGAG